MSKETDSCIYCDNPIESYNDSEFCDDCFQDMLEFDK